MNADMLNRGMEDLSPSLSLSLIFFRGAERPLRPPLDPPEFMPILIPF
jgi:hypothetical protein